MAAYLIIRAGLVVNVITWDGQTSFDPGDGAQLVEAPEGVGPGWTYDGEVFTPPQEPEPEPEAPDLRPTKSRFGDLFRDEQHMAMNLIKWQIRQMDAVERAIPGNPLVFAEILFDKFALPAEFIELDLPIVADGLGVLGMLGVFGDDAATEVARILRNELPS